MDSRREKSTRASMNIEKLTKLIKTCSKTLNYLPSDYTNNLINIINTILLKEYSTVQYNAMQYNAMQVCTYVICTYVQYGVCNAILVVSYY